MPKEIHAILTQTLACFLPDRAKDLSAPLYVTAVSSLFIKMFKDALGCKNVILLHGNDRNVSTNYVVIFRGVRTRIQTQLQCVEITAH